MPKKTKNLFRLVSLIIFFLVILLISFLFSKNLPSIEALTLYPGDSGYVVEPSWIPCNGCDCAAGETCSCDGCEGDHYCTCSGSACQPESCDNGMCQTGESGCTITCGACSDPEDPEDPTICQNVAPTVYSDNPINGAFLTGETTFQWHVTNWGNDCAPDDANSFSVYLLKYYSGVDITNKNNYFEASYEGLGTATPANGSIIYYWGTIDGKTYLEPGNTYYWYVDADNGPVSGYSAIRSFTTGVSLTGNIYQDNNFTFCNSAQNNIPLSTGTIDCSGGSIGAAYAADIPNPSPGSLANTYACQDSSNSNVLTVNQEYTVSASPPAGWSIQGYCTSDNIPVSGGSLTLSDSQIVNVYLRSYTSTWWQAVGADVRAEGGGIESLIPLSATNPYLLIDGINIKHGVAQATGIIDLGTQVTDPDNLAADSDDWGAENVGLWGDKTFNYDFWIKKLSDKLQPYTDSLTSGLWQKTGEDITFAEQTINGKVFLITDGKVIINGDITVSQGSSLVVVSQGDIEISPDVSNLQGYYISDGTIKTGHTSGGDTNQLVVEGGLIGIAGVTLERNFSSDRNNIDPAEQFVFRPDILANINDDLKVSAIKQWQEIAP